MPSLLKGNKVYILPVSCCQYSLQRLFSTVLENMYMYLYQMDSTYLNVWLSASRFPLDIISNSSKYILESIIKKERLLTYFLKADKNQQVTDLCYSAALTCCGIRHFLYSLLYLRRRTGAT